MSQFAQNFTAVTEEIQKTLRNALTHQPPKGGVHKAFASLANISAQQCMDPDYDNGKKNPLARDVFLTYALLLIRGFLDAQSHGKNSEDSLEHAIDHAAQFHIMIRSTEAMAEATMNAMHGANEGQ